MHKHNDFDVVLLRELVSYDPKTGVLTWKRRQGHHFDVKPVNLPRALSTWNARYAGREIKSSTSFGHVALHINIYGIRRRMMAHRAAWAIVHGEWPEHLIDHVNGDPSDNRISNLRCCTSSENNRNKKITPRNTSGFVGVTFYKRTQQWRAWVKIEGKTKSLGYHDKKADAIAARRAADAEFGFDEARKYQNTQPYEVPA